MKKMSTASKMVDSEQVKRKVVNLICWAYYSQHFAVWYANTIQICIVQSGFNDFAISNDDQFWFRHKPKSDIFFHQKWFCFFNIHNIWKYRAISLLKWCALFRNQNKSQAFANIENGFFLSLERTNERTLLNGSSRSVSSWLVICSLYVHAICIPQWLLFLAL